MTSPTAESGAVPQVYLLDVEGTVAPIALVYEVMFPYARRHLGAFLTAHGGEPEVAADLALLRMENQADREVPDSDAPYIDGIADLAGAAGYLLWLMDQDRKSTALKAIQGRVWQAGFESGELKGELFPDVAAAIERWSGQGRVAIYSSGSVAAQKLFFRYSSAGDLSGRITAYFDTRVGAKREAASYLRIAEELGVAPGRILFFSDVVAELDAARVAGCGTRLVVRPGNAPVAEGHGHGVLSSFQGV